MFISLLSQQYLQSGIHVNNLPRTMANIWVAFFSFCWEIFLLLMRVGCCLIDVWVLPLGKASVWNTLATLGTASMSFESLFFSTLREPSGGEGDTEVGLVLPLVGGRSWWLTGVAVAVSTFFCFWGLVLSSNSMSSPSWATSLMKICWQRSTTM